MTSTSHTDAELRALAEAATPGPWRHYHSRLRPTFGPVVNEIQSRGKTPIVHWGGFDDSGRSKPKHKANAAFIAAANPQTILSLLDRNAALQQRVEEMEAALAVIQDDRGHCSVCGSLAAGTGGGVLMCDCNGRWNPPNAQDIARAALSKEAER